MKVYATEDIRNVAIVGHGGVGKTTIAEAALFHAGTISRMGSVAEGNTTADWDEDEHERQFSLGLSVVPLEWAGRKINLIDTPGYADFVSEMICGLRAADLALVVVDAVSGPEVGTDRAWEYAEEGKLPKMIFVNRMDRENADFGAVVTMLQERWGHQVVPIQLPIGAEGSFEGVVNLLHMRAYFGAEGEERDVPADLIEEATVLRAKLIEEIAENDETLMEKFFNDEELDEDELEEALRRELVNREIIPVLCGAGGSRIGERRLLDAFVLNGPSPLDRPRWDADGETVVADATAPAAALVFKTSADPYVGRLSFLRVVRGEITPDMHLWNVQQEGDERLHTLLTQRGKDQEQAERLPAGDIGVVAKLAHSATGDTLVAKEAPITLPPLVFPAPVYSMAVTPRDKASVDKMGPSLQRIAEETPGLELTHNALTGETVLAGLGDAHLEVAVARLARKFKVEVDLTLPRVPYRETVSGIGSADYTHKKQTGGHGQYARVVLQVEPLERGAGVEFESKVVGGSVPREFIPAVEKGVAEARAAGVLAGHELTDCKIRLLDGKHHPVDSSEMAFKLAASHALHDAVQAASGLLLEPVMRITVRVPAEAAGDVVGNLNTKRAQIHGITPDGTLSVIEAEVPLAEVQRYASELRSLTHGRGVFELEFDHYGDVPSNVAQQVIAAHQAPAAV